MTGSGRNRRSRRTLFTASLALTLFAIGAAPVYAADDADAAPPGGVDIGEPQQSKDRTEIVHLYYKAKTDTSAAAAYTKAVAQYKSRYGVDIAQPAVATQTGGVTTLATAATYKTLSVAWVRQSKSYYCGPATALMILRTRGFATSHIDGTDLSQTALAGEQYLTTESGDLTTTWPYYQSGYTVNDMSRGLNRWAYGTYSGGFGIDQIGSGSQLKEIVGYSIDAGRPFAVSTYEAVGGSHYNSHPTDREIGHWTAVYGYESSGSTTKVVDPASGLSGYEDSAQKFYISTSSFATYAGGRYSVW